MILPRNNTYSFPTSPIFPPVFVQTTMKIWKNRTKEEEGLGKKRKEKRKVKKRKEKKKKRKEKKRKKRKKTSKGGRGTLLTQKKDKISH